LCRAAKILFLFVKVGVLLSCLSASVYGQDLRFSQLFGSPLYLNCATAGIHGQNKWTAHYRNQYTGLGSYVSYASSFDAYVPKLHGGLGIQVVHQDQFNRIFQQEGVWLSYAYQTLISNKVRLHGGIEAAYETFNVDFSKLTVLQQIDPLNGQINGSVLDYEQIGNLQSQGKMDIGAGILAEYKDGFLGVSLKHLDQTGWGWEKKLATPMLVSLHGSYRIHPPKSLRSTQWGIAPFFDFVNQGAMKKLSLGVMGDIGAMNIGLSLRNTVFQGDGWNIFLGWNNGNWRINYSFEQTTATKWNAPRIGHELSLAYSWQNKKKSVGAMPYANEKGQPSRLRCPNFFK
jgi:type IX secretion system PorP/SprF family membrane protein